MSYFLSKISCDKAKKYIKCVNYTFSRHLSAIKKVYAKAFLAFKIYNSHPKKPKQTHLFLFWFLIILCSPLSWLYLCSLSFFPERESVRDRLKVWENLNMDTLRKFMRSFRGIFTAYKVEVILALKEKISWKGYEYYNESGVSFHLWNVTDGPKPDLKRCRRENVPPWERRTW